MTTAAGPRLVLTVEQAAERLGIGRTLMYALLKAGVVESICIGRLRRIPADALDSYVEGLRSAPQTPLVKPAESRDRIRGSLPDARTAQRP